METDLLKINGFLVTSFSRNKLDKFTCFRSQIKPLQNDLWSMPGGGAPFWRELASACLRDFNFTNKLCEAKVY